MQARPNPASARGLVDELSNAASVRTMLTAIVRKEALPWLPSQAGEPLFVQKSDPGPLFVQKVDPGPLFAGPLFAQKVDGPGPLYAQKVDPPQDFFSP